MQGAVLCWEVADVAPGERGEAEVENAVEVIEGDAHVKANFGGEEAFAEGFLHDGEGFEVEPTSDIFDF